MNVIASLFAHLNFCIYIPKFFLFWLLLIIPFLSYVIRSCVFVFSVMVYLTFIGSSQLLQILLQLFHHLFDKRVTKKFPFVLASSYPPESFLDCDLSFLSLRRSKWFPLNQSACYVHLKSIVSFSKKSACYICYERIWVKMLLLFIENFAWNSVPPIWSSPK